MENEANTTTTAQQSAVPSVAPAENFPSATVSQNPKRSIFSKNKKLLLILSVVVIVVIGILVVFYLSAVNKTRKLNSARNQVYQATKQGDYVTAQKAAKEGFAIDSKDPYLVKNYIDAVTSQGNATGKEADALKTVEPYIQDLLKDSNNVDDLLSAGYAYEAAGQYEKALTYYEKAISINPKSAEAYFHKGHVYEFLNKQNLAFADYDKAYELNPEDALILMGKGREAAARGDANGAFNFFKKSSEVKNVSFQIKSEALTSAAMIKHSQIIYMREAIDLAHKAVLADPHFSPALGEYGYLLSINGDPHNGMSYLNLAIKANPRISKNYWQGGVVLRGAKNYSDAVKYLNVAAEKVDNDNTLIGSQAKKRVMGLIYYDLARTYYGNDNASSYVIQSLKYAVSLDPTLKDLITNDENKYKVFKQLETNPEFIALIK